MKKLNTFLIFMMLGLGLSACSIPKGDTSYIAAGFNKTKVYVVNSQTTAPVSYTVTVYDGDGNYLAVLADYTLIGAPIRGIAAIDPFTYILSIENIDRLDILDYLGNTRPFAVDANFNGTIYDVARDARNGNVYAIETNTIERFDAMGRRFGTTATPYINTTLGTCVLSVPRQMVFSKTTGKLVVTSTTNNRLNVYDVATGTPSCVSFNISGGANTPLAILSHSDGNIYVGNNLATNSQIVKYNATASNTPTVVFNTNVGVISSPTAMAEMPDKSILVASDGTDSIVRIDTNGNILNNPFIKNTFTGSVTSILVVPGQ